MKHYYTHSMSGIIYFLLQTLTLPAVTRIDHLIKILGRICGKACLPAMIFFSFFVIKAQGQTQAFVDNFNRAFLASGSPTTYSITVTAGDGGANINTSSFLEFTDDASAAANVDGIVYVSGLTQDFAGTYNQILHSNACSIEWTFNFRYNRTANPSGLAASNYGTAIILASSNGIFSGAGAGYGYAVVYGNPGTPDPIRLVKYSGGLSGTITTIISSGNNDISAANNYVSVRVKYEPTADNWSLYIRDDGGSSWADPSAGVSNQKGSTISDNTYTSISLTHFGFYWAYATAAAQTSQFDNFGVLLTATNPPLITVSTTSLPSFGTIAVGNSSSPQNFTVSGTNVTNNINISPPTGFEVRTGSNPFSSSLISLVQTNGIVAETNIDVRFSPGNASASSGNITCASTGAVTRTIAVSGIGSSSGLGLELYLTNDPSLPDNDHTVTYPHSGIGNGTLYGVDDWTYNSPHMIFFAVPVGTQPFGASEFEINWDASKATLVVTNGNMFDFIALQDISAGKKRINLGASSNLNISPSEGKYLVQLDFTIIQPGYNEITITGTDFRYFSGDEQQTIPVTTHSGSIKFYLGDFSSENNVTTRGDGKINFDDLVQFALSYFSESDGDPSGYKAKFDIGPTNTNGNYFTMPNPDGHIQFEDLAIFSIGYGKTAAHQLPKGNTLPVKFSTRSMSQDTKGMITVPLAISADPRDVRVLSVSVSYPPSSLEYAGYEKCGEMNHEYCFMAAKAKNNTVTLDAAVIGTEHEGLSKEGIFANLIFKERSTAISYHVNIQYAKARDSNNDDIQILTSSDDIQTSDVPKTFAVAQNYPNPFNPSTAISYQLSAACYVKIDIFDILGHTINTLVNKQQDAGYYCVQWDGKNTQHQPVSSGIYFYKFQTVDHISSESSGYVNIKKMLLLK